MRDYGVMRQTLARAVGSTRGLSLGDFAGVQPSCGVPAELSRLISDGLVEGEVLLDPYGACVKCVVSGITDEGRDFYRLIENEEVWRIVLDTLSRAGVDVSYPLLKDVCEEIVKRYVTSFIPRM